MFIYIVEYTFSIVSCNNNIKNNFNVYLAVQIGKYFQALTVVIWIRFSKKKRPSLVDRSPTS